jgi:hypothetical protein
MFELSKHRRRWPRQLAELVLIFAPAIVIIIALM